jgi:hypothetical protein
MVPGLPIGRPVTPSSYATSVLITGRDCELLGFWAEATGAIAMYDSATVAGVGTAIFNMTGCAIGWNPFPVALVNGLVVNAATATNAVFVII